MNSSVVYLIQGKAQDLFAIRSSNYFEDICSALLNVEPHPIIILVSTYSCDKTLDVRKKNTIGSFKSALKKYFSAL